GFEGSANGRNLLESLKGRDRNLAARAVSARCSACALTQEQERITRLSRENRAHVTTFFCRFHSLIDWKVPARCLPCPICQSLSMLMASALRYVRSRASPRA